VRDNNLGALLDYQEENEFQLHEEAAASKGFKTSPEMLEYMENSYKEVSSLY